MTVRGFAQLNLSPLETLIGTHGCRRDLDSLPKCHKLGFFCIVLEQACVDEMRTVSSSRRTVEVGCKISHAGSCVLPLVASLFGEVVEMLEGGVLL